jgi:hypothetical protein
MRVVGIADVGARRGKTSGRDTIRVGLSYRIGRDKSASLGKKESATKLGRREECRMDSSIEDRMAELLSQIH